MRDFERSLEQLAEACHSAGGRLFEIRVNSELYTAYLRKLAAIARSGGLPVLPPNNSMIIYHTDITDVLILEERP